MTIWDTIGSFFYNLSNNFISIPRLLCICAVIIGYFFGLFQSAFFISKIRHVDIYSEGSGNPGTTNMFRVMGFFPGLLTFLLDIGKVVGAIFLTQYIFLTWLNLPIDPIALKLYTGLGVVLGHNFPIYLRGKGGKGVAATCAVIVCLGEWKYIIVGVAVFLIVLLFTGYVSLASMAVVIVSMFEFLLFTLMNYTYVQPDWLVDCQVIMILFAVLVLVTHRKNIVRLLTGEESKFHIRNKHDDEIAEEEYEEDEEYYVPESELYLLEMEDPDEDSQRFLEHAGSLFEEHAALLAEMAEKEEQKPKKIVVVHKEDLMAESLIEELQEAVAVKETGAAGEETSEDAAAKEAEGPKEAAEEEASGEADQAKAISENEAFEEAAGEEAEESKEAAGEDASGEAEEVSGGETGEGKEVSGEAEAVKSKKAQAKEEKIKSGDYRTNHNKAPQQKKKKKHSSTKKKKSGSTKKKRK